MIGSSLVVLVAALHVYFLVLEMWLWDTPRGRRVFGLSAEFSAASKALAANQGLYNGFLAAGLLWALWRGDIATLLFFLGCVVVAGVYGAFSVNRRIFFVQALPALLALGAVLTGR